MSDFRIKQHPILPIPKAEIIEFYWQDQKLFAHSGETISAALFANGIRIFGHHHKDQSPQGIFCANGQCAQCMVVANGQPVKSCMEKIKADMRVFPANGLPELPLVSHPPKMKEINKQEVPVLIIGGGPAGLSAAIELGKLGVKVLLIDDKHRLGGKLVLQTHRFFGSSQAVYAGTRGIDIATKLEEELLKYKNVEVWVNTTALGVYSDQYVGLLQDNEKYILIKPKIMFVACGAREKFLAFTGNTLPGVYGAGAFQTLVNRDLVRPAEKLFIVGGGNVGLIAGYHALQAGIGVVGLVEALPDCGGYKVHKDKLHRMGVPIMTSHTILSANGKEQVESVTVAEVDQNFKPIPGTEKSFLCDSILIAVGLDPVDEFYKKGLQYGIQTFVGGDAEEIAEASAAIFSGKIRGREIAKALGLDVEAVPQSWYRTSEILKSRPGQSIPEEELEYQEGVMPVIHCTQEIPCNPCSELCPHGLIHIEKDDIRSIPTFLGNGYCCEVCEQCVAGCPGLAITLVDYRNDINEPTVSVPYEFIREPLQKNDTVTAMDTEGNLLGKFEVVSVHSIPESDRTLIVHIQAPREIAPHIAGIQIQDNQISQPMDHYVQNIEDEMIVCRCERVTAGEIRSLIRQGYRDFNEIKTVTRAGMGSCGGKTCTTIIKRLFREEGIPDDEVTDQTKRPLFMEVPLEKFAGVNGGQE
jgi:NADPH-dependent 2,4-dienoyl-CoA reductase/sulfur reductase-like enzyme/formate hydrogenlyase subunit 6/NADH:ubiquinone oxidoreductase subunit I/bacterioferritin-associated ferredoxin